MGLSKHKKKYWRKCLPGIEEEIIKAKELKEIDDVSFDIKGKTETKDIKYSTVPRVKPRKHIPPSKIEITDIYSDKQPMPVLSKRQQKMLEERRQIDTNLRLANKKRSNAMCQSAMSYFPPKKEHEELLLNLQQVELKKMKMEKKFEFKVKAEIDEKETKNISDEEDTNDIDADAEMPEKVKRKMKTITLKERKQNLIKKKGEIATQKMREKEKEESHGLRNIDRFNKEISKEQKQKLKRLTERKELEEDKKIEKQKEEDMELMPFLMPSEVTGCLRTLQVDYDSLWDSRHSKRILKTKTKKGPKQRKMTKMVKKSGLV